MTTRDWETIRRQCAGITRGKGGLPGAWWVGTDKSLPLRDAHLEHRHRDREKRKDLARSIGADPEMIWRAGGRLVGFTPLDPEEPGKALRPDRRVTGMWVPNKRSKAGKDLAQAVEDYNRHRVSDDLPGIQGGITRIMHGSRYVARPHFIIAGDIYPVATIAEDPDNTGAEPDDFYGPLTVDPELWERMPLSWLARIIEESEAEEVDYDVHGDVDE